MRTTLVLALLLLAGFATAQTMIPIGAESSVYSYTRMRGYCFQAPIEFTIVEVRVPDSKQHGTQHAVIFKPTAKPPAYSATAYTPPMAYLTGPSANKIPCNVPVNKGAWVGILGGCGDTSVTHNSYGPTTPYNTMILGSTPVSLIRFITQTNVPSNQGSLALYSSSTGSLGRVEVYVIAGAGANLTPSGTGGTGTSVGFLLTSTNDAGRAYQMGTSLGNGPIPIDTRSLALSPDPVLFLSVSGLAPTLFQNYAGLLDTNGQAKASLALPALPSLKGVAIYTSFVTLLSTAPSGVSDLSPEFKLIIT